MKRKDFRNPEARTHTSFFKSTKMCAETIRIIITAETFIITIIIIIIVIITVSILIINIILLELSRVLLLVCLSYLLIRLFLLSSSLLPFYYDYYCSYWFCFRPSLVLNPRPPPPPPVTRPEGRGIGSPAGLICNGSSPQGPGNFGVLLGLALWDVRV